VEQAKRMIDALKRPRFEVSTHPRKSDRAKSERSQSEKACAWPSMAVKTRSSN